MIWKFGKVWKVWKYEIEFFGLRGPPVGRRRGGLGGRAARSRRPRAGAADDAGPRAVFGPFAGGESRASAQGSPGLSRKLYEK